MTMPKVVHLRPEPCLAEGCTRTVSGPNWRGHRCGGILFGTKDDPGIGCGRFFCDTHLVGKLGPFYCRPCWEQGILDGKLPSSAPREGKNYRDPDGHVWLVTEVTDKGGIACERLDGRLRDRRFMVRSEWDDHHMSRIRDDDHHVRERPNA